MSDNNSIEEKVFMNPDHSSQVLLQLSELWRDKKLCDAIVEIGPVRIYVHRLLLLAGCPYLLTIGAQHEVPLLEFSLPMSVGVEGLNVFLTYLYDGVLHLTTANLISVERIAEVFRVESILKFCKEFRDSGFHNKVPTYKKYVTVANVVKTKKNTQVKFVEKKAYVKIKEEPVEIEDDELEDDELEVENKRPRIECSSPSDVTKTTVSSCSPLPVVSLPNISETSISSQSFISKALEKFLPSPATIIKSTTDASVPSQPPIKMVASSKLKQIVSGLSERPQKPLYPTVPCPTLINTHSLLDKLPTSVANGSTSSAQNSVDKNTVCTAQALSRTPTPVTCTESSDQGTTMYIKQEPVEEAESTSLVTESQPESASSFGRRANFVRQVACNTQPVPGSTQETLEPIPESIQSNSKTMDHEHPHGFLKKVGEKFCIKDEYFNIDEIRRPQGHNKCQSTGHIHKFVNNEIMLPVGQPTAAVKGPHPTLTPHPSVLQDEPDLLETIIAKDSDNATQISAESEKPGFANIREENYQCSEKRRNDDRTEKSTRWGVKLFKDWLLSKSLNVDFEQDTPATLNTHLQRFYVEAKTKRGEPYSRSAIVGMRAAINRHITSPPYSRSINISQDREFMSSNQALVGIVKEMKWSGCDKTKHKEAISEDDIKKLYEKGILSNDNPQALQYKVWFEISLHLGKRGQERLHALTAKSFCVKIDDCGAEYVEMNYNKVNKNQHSKAYEVNYYPRMYSTGEKNCPVFSFKLFMLKRNKNCDAFFQRPKIQGKNFILAEDVWFENAPLGINKLGGFMKEISKAADLSKIYTNHCIRATTILRLSHAGVESSSIVSMTGHRNERSLQGYILVPSSKQRKHYSNILSTCSSSNNTSTGCYH